MNLVPVLLFLDSPVKPGNDGHFGFFVIPRLDRGIQRSKVGYRFCADGYWAKPKG